MEKRLYVIYDSVAEQAGPIFEAKNDGTAWRQYEQVRDKKIPTPKDFSLIRVGTFDDETLDITPETTREINANLSIAEEIENEAQGI